jgi:hypothetical protein
MTIDKKGEYFERFADFVLKCSLQLLYDGDSKVVEAGSLILASYNPMHLYLVRRGPPYSRYQEAVRAITGRREATDWSSVLGGIKESLQATVPTQGPADPPARWGSVKAFNLGNGTAVAIRNRAFIRDMLNDPCIKSSALNELLQSLKAATDQFEEWAPEDAKRQ